MIKYFRWIFITIILAYVFLLVGVLTYQSITPEQGCFVNEQQKQVCGNVSCSKIGCDVHTDEAIYRAVEEIKVMRE